MSTELVLLALLMGLVTYPARALPLLVPGIERLPPAVLRYLRLVGPAVLAALAGVTVLVGTGPDGAAALRAEAATAGVVVCVAITARRRSLLAGLAAGVAVTALLRGVGLT